MMSCSRMEIVTVLRVDFHNEGCVAQILQSTKYFPGIGTILRSQKGVQEVKIDRGTNKLTAVGTMDPWKLRDWIENTTNHKAEILCCANEQSADRQTQTRTLVLKMVNCDHHCDGCTSRIRSTILKIKGVEHVTIETSKNQITVKGTMNTYGFAEYVSKKIQRHLEIIEPKTENFRCGGLTTCQAGRGWCRCNQCSQHICRLPAPGPQLWSDENPNACSLM